MAVGTGRRSAHERTALAAAIAFALLLAFGGIALPRLRTAEPAPEPMPRPMVEPVDVKRSEAASEPPVTERTVAIAEGSVRAFCKLRRRVAGTDRAFAYVGAFAIEDDGGNALLDGATVNNDEVAFALPRRSKA